MNRLARSLANEARLTLSLPRSGFELFAKAGGLFNMALFTKVALDQPDNPLLHSSTERALTTGAASGFALMGLVMLIGGNRSHATDDQAHNQAYLSQE